MRHIYLDDVVLLHRLLHLPRNCFLDGDDTELTTA
jgi:hypothetical protein